MSGAQDTGGLLVYPEGGGQPHTLSQVERGRVSQRHVISTSKAPKVGPNSQLGPGLGLHGPGLVFLPGPKRDAHWMSTCRSPEPSKGPGAPGWAGWAGVSAREARALGSARDRGSEETPSSEEAHLCLLLVPPVLHV